ncbi:uncharacterized protein KIAA0825 isoform X2 [Xenopus laevis]|uniref:Uncharacterized protein KIAA0825 isoform X2 n=1 Tax=Xenopus laevis TaxID=8355 RepID=A0A8J0VF00_XENLA|nr:uncharacterized protein KIAA0825 isoform X2 [Xenopus laevis]
MDREGEECFNFTFMDCVLDTFPDDLEYQQILDEIDEKLKDNALCMEESLQNFKVEINEMCGSEVLKNNNDCLFWLNNYHTSHLKPPEAPHCEVLGFLKALQHFLKNNENQEDLILHFLLELNTECRVSFPFYPSGGSSHCISQTSLHAVDDDFPMDMQTAWDDVRLHLRRYLVGKLQNCNNFNSESSIQVKTQCLQQFLFLYPEKDVLTKYQNIQQTLVVTFLHFGDRRVETALNIYQDAVPKVISVIKDDLHVLRNIVDTPLIIKFIKETFFEAITEEMQAFVDVLSENTTEQSYLNPIKTVKGKQKPKMCSSVSTPVNHQRKQTGLYISLDKLKSLADFTRLFLSLEEQVEKAASAILFFKCSEVKGNIDENLKKDWGVGRSNEALMLDESLLHTTDMPTFKFGWKNILNSLVHPLLQCLPAELENIAVKILQQETEEYSSVDGIQINLVRVNTSCNYYGATAEKQKPKKVAKFCFNIIKEFDSILPLALACQDVALLDVRACFLETFSKVAALILAKLEEHHKQFPCKAPLQSMYATLSTAIYVLHHLNYYYDQMSKKSLFLVTVQRYQEFINNLQTEVIHYCISACSTSIFQDAESHNWDDNKEFYEGERCSFSVQMWHYFCCGLRHDLWTILPPCLAQDILREIVEQTLALLTFRYSQAHPNYKRVSQLRVDIMAIFSCVENMLWSVCSSSEDLLRPRQQANDIFNIHSHCNSLLPVMAVLSTPLETLHKIITKEFSGFPTSPPKQSLSTPLGWIVYFKPELFQFSSKTPSAVEMAVQGQLKLLLSQPCCNWNLLLKTLLHSECLVAKTLLTCSIHEMAKRNHEYSESNPCLVNIILTVFAYCTLTPTLLSIVVESYMNQEKLWDFLCSITACRASVAHVIGYLKNTLKKSVLGIVKQVTSFVVSREPIECPNSCMYKYSIPETLLDVVPEKWKFTAKKTKMKASEKGPLKLIAEALSIVIRKLPSVIACVPSPIKYFYSLAERKVSKQYSESVKTGILVWNLIDIICEILHDGNTIENSTGHILSRWCKENLTAVSDCLQRIAGNKTEHNKEATQKVFDIIEEKTPKWIENQFLKAKSLSINSGSAMQEDSSVLKDQDSELELTEQRINMMVLDICHKPGGSKYLRQIYHIIQLNEEYLNAEFTTQEPDEISSQSRHFQLTLTSGEDQLSKFNPLHSFTLPASGALSEHTPIDWPSLVSCCFSVHPLTFQALLEKRSALKGTQTSEAQTTAKKILKESLISM